MGGPWMESEVELEPERLDLDDMFLDIAAHVALRGTCSRAKVGTVIVKDKRIVSMGYNGAPPGMPHCTEVGCDQAVVYEPDPNNGPVRMRPAGCIRTVHAEANAIAWAARAGIATEGATLYSTHGPCHTCAQLILSAGIASVHYETIYRAQDVDLLDEAGIEVIYHEVGNEQQG